MPKLLPCLFFFCLIFNSNLATAQTDSKQAAETNYSAELTQKLAGLTAGMPTNKQIMLDGTSFPVYQEDGTQLTKATLFDLLMSEKYKPVFYLNDQKEIKACVLQLLSLEEQGSMKVMHKNMEESNTALMDQSFSFSGIDMEGNEVSLSTLKGKVIVFNFWFTGCKPCVMEMPNLNELVEKYGADNVVFLAPTFNSKSQVEKFLTTKVFDYQIVPDAQAVISQYTISSFPTHVVINQEGKVVFAAAALSPTTIQRIDDAIEELLGK